MEVHGLSRVIFVWPLPVPAEALAQSVGGEEVRAGEAGHLGWSGLASGHSGVEILTLRTHFSPLGGD